MQHDDETVSYKLWENVFCAISARNVFFIIQKNSNSINKIYLNNSRF